MSAPRVDRRMVAWTALTYAAVAAAHWATLRHLGVASPSRAAAMTVLPVVLTTLAALAWLRRVASRRARGLAAAMRSLAAGDYSVRLPDPPTAEFLSVQRSFSRMAEALEDARARLVDADARRRRLFADLAHELATPVSAVLGVVDTLTVPALVPDEAARARLHAALLMEAQLLARLVDDVRDLSALEDPDVSVQRASTDLGDVVRRAAEVARASGLGGLRVELPRDAVVLRCDATRIEQVLRNLLSNAQRHTPPGGEVRVRLWRDPAGAQIEVEDSGPGVPDALLDRLGERLFRADPSRDRRTGGGGMGLAIARGIVARHDGALRFQRGSLGGLRALVTLPDHDPRAEG